ncbi:unnamed protein product [Caenorhabditis angaria]|uniref:Domain of unknown function DX domain-containing protein n=1 Tax=Caenorhabditis angaria TaxID=860376 RepID=A0A9P1IHC0_9PELO|nr:unnamed protein product [Caenorhabditis angaria]
MKCIILILLFLPTCFSFVQSCIRCPNDKARAKKPPCLDNMYFYVYVDHVECFGGHKAVHKVDGKCGSDRIATKMQFFNQEVCCPPSGAKCFGGSIDATVPPCKSDQYSRRIEINNKYLLDKVALCCPMPETNCPGNVRPTKQPCKANQYLKQFGDQDDDIFCCSLDAVQKCPDGSTPHSPSRGNDYEHIVDGHKFWCELSGFKCPLNDIPTNAPCSAHLSEMNMPAGEQFLFKFEQGPELCCNDAKCVNEKHPKDLPCDANQYEKEFSASRKVCCELEELKCVDGEKPEKQSCTPERYLTNLGVAENEQVCCKLDGLKCVAGESPTNEPCNTDQYRTLLGHEHLCCPLNDLKCMDGEIPQKQPCTSETYLTNLGATDNEDVCCKLDGLKCVAEDVPTNEPCKDEQYKDHLGFADVCCDFNQLKCVNDKVPTRKPCEDNQYVRKFGENNEFCCGTENMKCPDGKELRTKPKNNEEIGMELINGQMVYCDAYFECPNGIQSFPDSETYSNCGKNDSNIKLRLNFDELFKSAYLCCEDLKSCQITQSSYKFVTKEANEYGLTKSLLANQEVSGYIHQFIKNDGKQQFLCPIPIGNIWLEIYKPAENQEIPKEYLPVDFIDMNQEKSLRPCQKNVDCKGPNQFCGDYTSFAEEDGATLKFCYQNPIIPITKISKSFQFAVDSQDSGLKLCDSNSDCLKNDRICWKNDKKWNGKSGICIERKPIAFIYSRIFEENSNFQNHFYFAVDLENGWKNRDLLKKCVKNEECDIENGQFCDNIIGINGEKDLENKYCFKALKSPSPLIKPTIIPTISGLVSCQNCQLPSFCHQQKDMKYLDEKSIEISGICWNSQICADQQTALFLEPKCQNNEDCQKQQTDSNCQNGHCCPEAKISSDGSFSQPKHHYITQRSCNSTYNFQINFPNSFCDPKSQKLVVIGKFSKHGEKLKLSSNSKKCERNIDCGTGENEEVCIFDGKIGEGKCYLNPMTYKSPPDGFPIMAVIVPIIIIIIILSLIAGGYLYYKKRINKEEKNTEKSKKHEKKSQKKSISTPSSANTPV